MPGEGEPGVPGSQPTTATSGIQERKRDHLQIHLGHAVQAGGDVWAPFRFRHRAVPGFDRADVQLGIDFLGVRLEVPLVISGMTGGCDEAEHVNDRLAAVAAEHRVAMGVGSQRAAIEHPELRRSYEVVREHDVPVVLANVGAPQLLEWGGEAAIKVEDAIRMVDADAVAVHLNYLQECVQPEGETRARGVVEAIRTLIEDVDVPVIVKETGAGIGHPDARLLMEAGVAGIDVGGLGGTSFSAVETYRADAAGDTLQARIGRTFWDWGIPTPRAVEEVASVVQGRVPVIATGGVRNGLDCAKALALGADLAGMAGALLRAADASLEAAHAELRAVREELTTALFLAGCRNAAELRRPGVWLERPRGPRGPQPGGPGRGGGARHQQGPPPGRRGDRGGGPGERAPRRTPRRGR